MARRRRYGRSRPARNLVWQAWEHYTTVNDIATGVTHHVLDTLVPGIDTDGTIDGFDHQVTMERIRGVCAHEASSNENAFLPFSMAIFAVPAEVGKDLASEDMPNLFENGDGDDYPFMHNSLCDLSSSSFVPNIHTVDVKAKRRYDVGTRLIMSTSMNNYSDNIPNAPDLQIAWNLRVLWKLS